MSISLKDMTDEMKERLIYDADETENDIISKLTKNKVEFQKKLDANDRSVYWCFAGVFGVCFKDLRNIDLSSFTSQQLSRIPFSTLTIFPSKEKLPAGFDYKKLLLSGKDALPSSIKKLHKKGITGKGITVAVIDKYNDFYNGDVNKNNITIVDRISPKSRSDWHGYMVSSTICGKDNGIAPDCAFIYYPVTTDFENKTDEQYIKELYQDMMRCLKDILKRVDKGEKIDVVSISGSFDMCRTNEEKFKNIKCKEELDYEKIKVELAKNGCYVITAAEFWNDFSYCYKTDNFADKDDLDNYTTFRSKDNICVIGAGKTYPLSGTKNEYFYDGTLGSASWAIPQVAAIFALAKQENSDLNYIDFVELAKQTCDTNKEGVRIINAERICVKAKDKFNKNTKIIEK